MQFLAAFVLVWLVGTFGAVIVFRSLWGPQWGAFIGGVLLTTGFAATREAVLAGARTLFPRQGIDAEDFTQALLRKIRGRRHVIRRLWFGSQDVDHVVVGPDRALAIQTKWTSNSMKVWEDGSLDVPHHFVDDTAFGVRKINAFLNLSRRLDLPVDGVLVIWGPGVPSDCKSAFQTGGIQVVVGPRSRTWRTDLTRRWSATEPTASSIAATTELRAYRRKQATSRRRLLKRSG